ncbi:MAG: hypothetical protein PPFGHCPK_01446 (plasmid) [Spiroplasma endosymbiont of Drosophila atripex]|nr:MAG: hypothetical protein PPFGHCPK_01446 [Spiroplasma endosymbiont of Drosophila atripex]
MKCLLPYCYKKRAVYCSGEQELCEFHFNKILTKLEISEINLERERLKKEL